MIIELIIRLVLNYETNFYTDRLTGLPICLGAKGAGVF